MPFYDTPLASLVKKFILNAEKTCTLVYQYLVFIAVKEANCIKCIHYVSVVFTDILSASVSQAGNKRIESI